jgi:hypothetical protein
VQLEINPSLPEGVEQSVYRLEANRLVAAFEAGLLMVGLQLVRAGKYVERVK